MFIQNSVMLHYRFGEPQIDNFTSNSVSYFIFFIWFWNGRKKNEIIGMWLCVWLLRRHRLIFTSITSNWLVAIVAIDMTKKHTFLWSFGHLYGFLITTIEAKSLANTIKSQAMFAFAPLNNHESWLHIVQLCYVLFHTPQQK